MGVVRVVELGGHLRNGDGRILPEPLCRLLEPVASDHCEWGQADVLLTEALETSDRKIEASRQLIDAQDASVGGDDVFHLVGDERHRLWRPGMLRHPVCQRTGGTLSTPHRVGIRHGVSNRSAQVRVLERPMGVPDQGRGAQRTRCRRPEKGSDGPSSAFQLTIGDARRRAVQSHAIGLDNEVAGGEREHLLAVPLSCGQVPAWDPDPADPIGQCLGDRLAVKGRKPGGIEDPPSISGRLGHGSSPFRSCRRSSSEGTSIVPTVVGMSTRNLSGATGHYTTDGTPHGFTSITPFLAVDGADRALRFYRDVFGARIVDSVEIEGAVVHAELDFGHGRIQIGEPSALSGLVATPSDEPVCYSIRLYCPDVDAAVERATAAGATLLEPPDTFVSGDRFASIRDPFGVRWSVMTRVEDLSEEESSARVAAWAKKQAVSDS